MAHYCEVHAHYYEDYCRPCSAPAEVARTQKQLAELSNLQMGTPDMTEWLHRLPPLERMKFLRTLFISTNTALGVVLQERSDARRHARRWKKLAKKLLRRGVGVKK
jgi:hypothetical protein